jgi:hypothetical protein
MIQVPPNAAGGDRDGPDLSREEIEALFEEERARRQRHWRTPEQTPLEARAIPHGSPTSTKSWRRYETIVWFWLKSLFTKRANRVTEVIDP